MQSVLSIGQSVEEDIVVFESQDGTSTDCEQDGKAPPDQWQQQIAEQARALRDSLAKLLGADVLEAAAQRLSEIESATTPEDEETISNDVRAMLGRHKQCIHTLQVCAPCLRCTYSQCLITLLGRN